MPRPLTEDEALEKYEKISNPKKVEILDEALGYMQQHNGRSKSYCIGRATADFLESEFIEED